MRMKREMRMTKTRMVIGDDEFLPTRGPPRPRRSGTRPRRKRTEKKAATRVAFNICQMMPKRERSVLILASHITYRPSQVT